MKLRSAVIVLLFFSSVLSGCVSNDSENDERIEALELELSDSTANYDDAMEQILTLQNAIEQANAALAASDVVINELSINISELEIIRDNLVAQRQDLADQLNVSRDNNSALEEEISALDLSILDLNDQILELDNDLQESLAESTSLEETIAALNGVINSLTYTNVYVVEDCPLDNPGIIINVGYDDGEGIGIAGDGMISDDEAEYRIGECPGDFGMVYNETDTEQNWAQQRIVEMQGSLYFTVHDGIHGWELWRTDGTVDGSYLVKDIRQENCEPAVDPDTGEQYMECENWSSIYDDSWDGVFNDVEFVAGSDKIFFTAMHKMYGENLGGFANLWVSDGTEEGTYMVMDMWSAWDYNCDGCEFDYNGVTELVLVPGVGSAPDRVVFTAIRAIGGVGEEGYPQGEELWISDGTAAGTRMIANIEPETSSWSNGTQCCADWDGSVPRDIVFKGNQLWFTAETENYGREFYRFGLGLGGGLFLIKDINPGTDGSNPMYLTAGSGGMYLVAN
ncbi:MAG: hypothetical protein CL995_04420, partial [Euryarchaeota archaeon]|nr:hypothetical protein [Euryarchaeota archaeon]